MANLVDLRSIACNIFTEYCNVLTSQDCVAVVQQIFQVAVVALVTGCVRAYTASQAQIKNDMTYLL